MKTTTHKTSFSLTAKNRAYLETLGIINKRNGQTRKEVCLNDFLNECLTLAIEGGKHPLTRNVTPEALAKNFLLYRQAQLEQQSLLTGNELKKIAQQLQLLGTPPQENILFVDEKTPFPLNREENEKYIKEGLNKVL